MQDPNADTAPQGKAIDHQHTGASDVDHVWFEKNPGRVHRLRDLVPFESGEPLGVPPLGMTWRILVTRVSGGGRLRHPVPLPREVTNESVDETELAAIFHRVAAPDVVKACANITKMKKSGIKHDPS